MNIKKTFLELTAYTDIYGDEYLLRKFLPKNVIKDGGENYYLKIGESRTMFTAHLDTAAQMRKPVVHVFDTMLNKSGNTSEFVETDGSTLLGADDRTGVVIMLNMIEHNIPGLYYFFVGEEVGTIGSTWAITNTPQFFNEYDRCISFDRRGYGSIISAQMGGRCCSNEFVDDLSKELTSATGYRFEGDPTGIYTDSAVFMDYIPECTNLSVGYFNEHTVNEYQNLTYLQGICDGVLKVNWENLSTKRSCEPMDTPDPIRRAKKKGDLTDAELRHAFLIVEELIEDTQNKDCANRAYFMPGKEMLFLNYTDETDITSIWIYENGSIKIGQTYYANLEKLEKKAEVLFNWSSSYYDEIEEEEDDDDTQEVFDNDNDLKDDIDFEDDIDIRTFMEKIASLQKSEISVNELNDILNEFNKNVESLVLWIFHNHNNPIITLGLTWNDDKDIFEFDSEYL